MKHLRPIEEKKPKGAPDWHDSDAPDANGRFRDLSIKDLAAWLIKTRKKDVKRISGSLTQQIVFNRNDDPKYAEKMEKTRKEVYKQLGREDLLESTLNEGYQYFDGEMARDLKGDSGVKFKKGDKVTLEIQPNNYVIYGPNKTKIIVNKRDFRGAIDQYVIYESITEGMSKSAIKKAIKVIDKQIDTETGGDGEALDNETLQALEQERERLLAMNEKREDVGKYNTVKKVIKELGRRPSEQELATFINNNYYDVTEVERGDDDPQANDKIADLVAFYKFDIDDWQIAWFDAQNESLVTEASTDRMIKQIKRALKDGLSIFKLPMATQKYYAKNKSDFETVEEGNYKMEDIYDLIAHHRFDKDFKKLSSKDKEWVENDAAERGFNESLLESDMINMYYSLIDELYEAKPGPDAYMTGLSDEEKEEKEAKMKKQAEMDDDDPDSYEELPGDEEARESGKVKKSKHTTAYNKKFKSESMKNLKSFDNFVTEKRSDLWSPFQKADILAGDMFGAMGLYRLEDDELDQIIDLKKADKLAKKMFGEFGFKTLAAKEMEDLLDNNPKLLRESQVTEAKGLPSHARNLSIKLKTHWLPDTDNKDIYFLADTNKGQTITIDLSVRTGEYKVIDKKDNVIYQGGDPYAAAKLIESAVNEFYFENDEEERLQKFVDQLSFGDELEYRDGFSTGRGSFPNTRELKKELDSNCQLLLTQKQGRNWDLYVGSDDLVFIIQPDLGAKNYIQISISSTKEQWNDESFVFARQNGYSVYEAFIGPFVFNDKMSDDELLGMYNGALDGYANYSKGFQHSKSDYKRAYQEIEKILKKRGVNVDESVVTEEKIKYAKGKTYQSSGHWTVQVDSNSSLCDIRVNHSAGWRLDPHDDREETWELLDNGRQRATLYFRSGNIDKFAKQMFDLNDKTTWGNKTKLTAKDYADIIRVWIDMKKANESRNIGIFSDMVQDFKDFVKEKKSLNEAKLSKVHKAAKQGSYPAVIVVVQDGKVIHQEPVSTPEVAPATFNVMQKEYPKALLHLEDKTGKRLFSESLANENRMLRKGQFRFGAKLQYGIEDVNESYGFYGTLLDQFGLDEVNELYLDGFSVLGTNYDFTDQAALYYLNSKAGRWVADQVVEKLIGPKNMSPYYGHLEEIFAEYAKKGQWKKWSKEYDQFAEEDNMEEGLMIRESRSDRDEYYRELLEAEQTTNDQSPLGDGGMETGIKNKAKESGVPVGLLRIIMRRGLAAWKTGHRPGATQAQWGYARVNSFLTKQPGTWGKADSDIAKKVRDGGHDKDL